MTVTITPVKDTTDLYLRYPSQTNRQPVHMTLDTAARRLWCTANGEVGNMVPSEVWYGIDRRYPVGLLTAESANKAMEYILPLAERVIAGATRSYDQHGNPLISFTGDATLAEDEIGEYLDHITDSSYDTIAVFDFASYGDSADWDEITANTTDAELAAIIAKAETELSSTADSGVAVCEGLAEFLEEIRKTRREELTD